MNDHLHADDHNRNAELQARVDRLIAAVEAHGIATRAAIDVRLDRLLITSGQGNGASIVARAWVDPSFAEQLQNDAMGAVAEMGFASGHQVHIRLRALFNTPDVHNVVVCSLCSCYPMALLGPPPAWYRSEAYRSRVVRDPRSVLNEFGVVVPESTQVHVWDSTADARYLVVPRRPANTHHLGEQELARLVSRDCLIGTGLPALLDGVGRLD